MSNIDFYYNLQEDRWYMTFDDDIILSISNREVEKKIIDGKSYGSHLDAFKDMCKDEIFNLIDYVDLTFSMKWVLTHLFKNVKNGTEGGM